MRNLFTVAGSQRGADKAAEEWLATIDPTAAVGSRHHIVPNFLLTRFANAEGQLRVRDRTSGAASIRSVADLGVKDFYTSVTIHQQLDSSLETILSTIEGNAATVIRTHVDAQAFSRPRFLTPDERLVLDTFVSFQFVRGMRSRRMMELIADYGMKLLHQGELAPGDIQNLSIVPHPNDHLRSLPSLSEKAFEHIAPRPVLFVRLDRPLLYISDEPVVFAGDGSGPDRAEIARKHDVPVEDVIHTRANRGVGLATASSIMVPVSPDAVIIYGDIGEHWVAPRVLLRGTDAAEMAEDLNARIIASAIDWVAAHPSNAEFPELSMPDPVPIMTVSDGGSELSAYTNSNTVRRPINRVRPDDVNLTSIDEADESV